MGSPVMGGWAQADVEVEVDTKCDSFCVALPDGPTGLRLA